MAKLTAAARKTIPASKFGVPAKALLHGAAKSSHHLGSVPKHGHPVRSVAKMGMK